MFTKITLDFPHNLFPELQKSIKFEDVTKGRKGAILVDVQNDLIPLSRSTTKYNKPAQKFKQVHYDIINQIKEHITAEFNNAMIEIYDNRYCTMGFHSDQALDLAENSYIAIYSCYENPQVSNPRTLHIKNKKTNDVTEFTMTHNSVIIFNLETNQQHLHKIILEDNKLNNKWLGVTFRLSKTFILHVDNIPYINQTNDILKLATEEESRQFYKLRSEENKSLSFQYPYINYTISPSDLLPIQ